MMASAAVLLSEAELRAALEPLLDRLLVERLRYFQLQLEPRLQSLIETALRPQAAEGRLGPEALLQAVDASADPNQMFAALFDATEALTGPARALIVTLGGESAVWRAQGVRLPDRFPLAAHNDILRPAPGRSRGLLPIHVRELAVGWLYWETAADLEPARLSRLQLLLRVAGLCLLSQALPAPRPADPEAAPRVPAAARPEALVHADPAARFAHLLIEDLALYLERDRTQEFAAAQRAGDAATRFQPEIERCRRAFQHRFQSGMEVFEAAAQTLGGR